jgi:hypothetical protein
MLNSPAAVIGTPSSVKVGLDVPPGKSRGKCDGPESNRAAMGTHASGLQGRHRTCLKNFARGTRPGSAPAPQSSLIVPAGPGRAIARPPGNRQRQEFRL